MSDESQVTVARLSLWQGILAALIAGVCGVTGSDIQLSAAQPATAGEIKATFNRRLPIGTIVPSVVGPHKFSALAEDPGGFSPSRSVWVPADGRDVPGSLYAKQVQTAVPDLRGLFLRGLNWSDTDRVRKDGNQDPGGAERRPGDYQADDLKAHKHGFTRKVLDFGSGAPKGVERAGGSRNALQWTSGPSTEGRETEPAGGTETRPRNSAVYYYIKIN